MTLDEAVAHAESIANECFELCAYHLSRGEQGDYHENFKCGVQHRQLARWLKDYKRILESGDCSKYFKKS